MLKVNELEEQLKTTYPIKVTSITQSKRMTNIEALTQLIDSEISSNTLVYEQNEEKLFLYKTADEEKIYIQFPGKESEAAGNKKRPYDFRPKIETKDGTIIKDLVFADMWGIIEEINEGHHTLIKSLSALFFRIGRMIDYKYTTEQYDYEIVTTKNASIICSGKHTLTWNKLCLDKDIIESLNFHISEIRLNDNTTISFEAFVYFFSLILENEDIKYYCKKQNLTSGRIPTSDSMLLLFSHFTGNTSLATLLQRYVSGFGVGKCKSDEIEPSTCGLIRLINYKELLDKNFLTANLDYKKDSTITVKGHLIRVAFKIKSPKTAILSSSNTNKEQLLRSKNWEVFDIESISEDENQIKRLATYLSIQMSI
ncbi:hypothetical protein SAMN05216391_10722 [Lachnospiraceae bacterium KHCPX20]|nr:hypothetical protein SAMN05216391_10722 [Lachnospiraceae bacterium KHCPX20]